MYDILFDILHISSEKLYPNKNLAKKKNYFSLIFEENQANLHIYKTLVELLKSLLRSRLPYILQQNLIDY